MPIYEFRCEGCQAVFEHLSLTRGETTDLCCPSCGGDNLSRVLSTCSSVVSGGGAASAPAAGASVQSRACANAGNCATITLPGGD